MLALSGGISGGKVCRRRRKVCPSWEDPQKEGGISALALPWLGERELALSG